MLRRSYLKSILAAMAVIGTGRGGLLESADAAPAPPLGGRAEKFAPATVADALNGGDGNSAVAFVLEYPKLATAAPASDQAALLRLVARDRATCDRTRPDRELAALTLLRPVAGDSATLADITRGFGGAMRVKAILPGIESKELRAILLQVAALSE